MATSNFRPRRIRLRDGREVTLRAIGGGDAPAIVEAFERLTAESRYSRFMQHKRELDPAALDRGVHPEQGRDFAFVATLPTDGGIDFVGAAQYVRAEEDDASTCEFAITIAEDWRGSGLATKLLGSLVRRARRDGYRRMRGEVMAANLPMQTLARKLKFAVRRLPDDATLVRVERTL